MNGKTYAYLDIAIQPPVGALLLDPRPAFAFRSDGSGILWANAAGVGFFDEAGMSALLGRRFSPASPLAQHVARLSKQLPVDHDRLEILRFNFGVSQTVLPAACRRLVLPGGGAALLALGATGATRESLATRAERLADTIAADDCLVAILDGDGKVLGASGGFDALAPASAAIDDLIGAVERSDSHLLKRPIEAGRGIRPAGAALITSGGERLFLLIVGPEERRAESRPQAAAVPPVAAASGAAPDAGGSNEVPAASSGPTTEAEPAPAPAPTPVRRFLWQLDADACFAFVSPALAEAVGAAATPAIGESWLGLADRLGLDPEQRVAEKLAGQSAWSGLTVDWPLEAVAERVAVELSALPVLARDRRFEGYRGFGLIHFDDRRPDLLPRPLARVAALVEPLAVEAEPAAPASPPAPPAEPAAPEPVVAESPAAPQEPSAPVEVPPATGEIAATAIAIDAIDEDDVDEDDVDDLARKIVERGGRPIPPLRTVAPPTDQSDGPAPTGPAQAPTQGSNVVRLPGTPARLIPRRLSGTEQDAFRRIAQALGARTADGARVPPDAEPPSLALPEAPRPQDFAARLLEKLPIGIVIYRDGSMLFANRAILDLLGYGSFEALTAAGGVEAIFPGGSWTRSRPGGGAGMVEARRSDGAAFAVEAKLHAVNWSGATALMLSLAGSPPEVAPAEAAPEASGAEARIAELEAILDTATDGVVVIDGKGRIATFNHAAEALFGIAADAVVGKPFTELLAEESRRAALDYLDGLAANGVASVLNDGREIIGKVPAGGLIPLFMTMGRLGESGKYCAVLRDITHWKNVEEELVAARRAAEAANAQKSDFLAKISHEIRTPLNAIIGFSEVMMEERFGPIGSDRYRAYLHDIHVSGAHLLSLINDLLDLSKIEAGKLELTSESVAVNEVIQECVALMQPQANRERIIIRTSLSANVPNVVADLRSLRQILLNLLSNAIKFTRAGGQVIVATALEENGEVVVRIRDTGIGMSEKDIETAMKPFRQVATSGRQREGTGLGLPLTKALVEANRAAFAIDSVPDQGTLVRITFPTTRVLAG